MKKTRSAHRERRTSRAVYEYEKKVRLSKEGMEHVKHQADVRGISEAEYMRERIEAALIHNEIAPLIRGEFDKALELRRSEMADIDRKISLLVQFVGDRFDPIEFAERAIMINSMAQSILGYGMGIREPAFNSKQDYIDFCDIARKLKGARIADETYTTFISEFTSFASSFPKQGRFHFTIDAKGGPGRFSYDLYVCEAVSNCFSYICGITSELKIPAWADRVQH